MNILEIILLPFTYFYRLVKLIVLSPYYLTNGIGKASSEKPKINAKATAAIAEAKTNNEKIVVREARSIVDEPIETLGTETTTPSKSPVINDAKRQALYNKYMEKARLEEQKRVREIEKIKQKTLEKEKIKLAKSMSHNEEEQKTLVEAQKKLDAEKKAGKVPFTTKFSDWWKKQNSPLANISDVELEARKAVLEQGFKETVKKDENLKPMMFTYIAKNPKGIMEQSEIEALTRMDVQSFLVGEGYEVYDIFPSKQSILNYSVSSKMKRSQLVFYLSQLSAYLKSGIALADSVKILYDQAKKKSEKAAWKSVYYDLSMGDVLSVAMDKRGDTFPKLLINMIKTAEMTGNLPDTLDDMVDYYSEAEQTKKQMKSAMTYPIVVLSFAFIVIIFILVYIVPKFTDIYKSLGSEDKIPPITRAITAISNFLNPFGDDMKFGSGSPGGLILFGVIIFVIFFTIYLYKNVRSAKQAIQEFAMHIPVFGSVIIYNEVSIFSKTFANLINHNVFITDSIGILSKITNNEIYKKLILETAENLNKGDPISKAFENQWAFPTIAYQMLITGEKTGRLGQMMEKVADYYTEQHRNIINQMKSLIEPALIITLAVVVGFILMAVLIPMFKMYQEIN